MKQFVGFWELPVLLMLVIYLPAAIYGIYFFKDIYSVTFVGLLAIFVMIYYWLYPRLPTGIFGCRAQRFFWRIGDQLNWTVMAGLAIAGYVSTIVIASLTVDFTPLGAALHGGSNIDIADARASFLANRTGVESLLRYSAVILGRAVMPFLVVYAYWTKNRYRHLMLIGLLLCYFVFLEKALPIFLFLPLVLLNLNKKLFSLAAINLLLLCTTIVMLGFLASGGLHDANKNLIVQKKEHVTDESSPTVVTKNVMKLDREGHLHHFYPVYKAFRNLNQDGIKYKVIILLNRALWIPYVTAYDWLIFQDVELKGELTYGRSIGILSWLIGEPKLQIERMVYKYQGLGGDGAANTVFLVDAKIAFGWLGVLLYCILLTLIAKVILSSNNEPAKIASVTSFFTVCLSPLTASILSGGLFFYILICLLMRPDPLRTSE